MAPAVLIALGVLFLINQYGRYSFAELWPILLIVIGAVKVAEVLTPNRGHTGP
jgi:hypothetical protein